MWIASAVRLEEILQKTRRRLSHQLARAVVGVSRTEETDLGAMPATRRGVMTSHLQRMRSLGRLMPTAMPLSRRQASSVCLILPLPSCDCRPSGNLYNWVLESRL